MATYRKQPIINEGIYHVFNRGVDKRDIFTDQREYIRALETTRFYRFSNLPTKLSKYLKLPPSSKEKIIKELNDCSGKIVEILGFCLMPNHFHFLLRQVKENGISRFISNFSNSYSKYFNTKHDRTGVLLQGLFKSVLVDSDEQLIHVLRYIHLNPVVAKLAKNPQSYPWSSLNEYTSPTKENICRVEELLAQFPSLEDFIKFHSDQIAYAKQLQAIKHLILE